jgi:hypothetical protein
LIRADCALRAFEIAATRHAFGSIDFTTTESVAVVAAGVVAVVAFVTTAHGAHAKCEHGESKVWNC